MRCEWGDVLNVPNRR